MKKYEGVVQDDDGNIITSATVTVKDYVGGANSTIYASDAIGSNINGFTNNSDGTFEFFAKDGRYNIEISKPGITTKTITNVLMQDTVGWVSLYGHGGASDGVTNAVATMTDGGSLQIPAGVTPTLPASYPLLVLEYHGPATPINVYQESGETTRFGKRVLRGQNAGSHNGNEYSLFVVEHHPVGSGTNGPTHADYALTVVNQKRDFTASAVVGELDGILIVVRNGGATSDSAGILANVVTYGTGFMAAMEATTAIISGVTTQQSIQTQIGVVDNVSPYYFGMNTKANTGALQVAYRADTTSPATWDYLFRGYQNGVEKFSVTGIGKINLFDSSGNKKSVVCEANALNVYANDGTTVIFQVNNSGNGAFLGNVSGALFGIGSAGISSTTRANITASTAGVSSLRIAHGTAPSAPVDGDMWSTTSALFIRINGVTKEVQFV